MAIRTSLAALLLALSPTPYAAWITNSINNVYLASSDYLYDADDSTARLHVSITENAGCTDLTLLLHINTPNLGAPASSAISDANIRLEIDDKTVATWGRARFTLMRPQGRYQSAMISVPLSTKATAALLDGRKATFGYQRIELNFDLTGSKAAVSQAISSCLTATTEAETLSF